MYHLEENKKLLEKTKRNVDQDRLIKVGDIVVKANPARKKQTIEGKGQSYYLTDLQQVDKM